MTTNIYPYLLLIGNGLELIENWIGNSEKTRDCQNFARSFLINVTELPYHFLILSCSYLFFFVCSPIFIVSLLYLHICVFIVIVI